MKALTAKDAETHSPDLVAENIAQLKALFPEAFTEGKVDFEVLKELLGGAVDEREEKYGLNWYGKRRARQLALTPSTGTLLPSPDDSVDWDSTQNLMIEGDNLEVLKLLQKSYARKVKLIYIDPPYNTGKDFVYPDDFQDNIKNYLRLTGQVDSNGSRLSSNTEASGRFHTDWLNMMYPRLRLARSLLREDGVLFISIDDGEVKNLRSICDEIFGEENFVATIIWEKKYAPQNDAKYLSDNHDFILLYARNKESWKPLLLNRSDEAKARYKNLDDDPRGSWKSSDLLRMEHRDNSVYTITSPTGRKWTPEKGTSWRHPEAEMKQLIANREIWFGPDGNSKPSRKRFLTEVKQGVVAKTIWTHQECGHNQEGTQVFKALFEDSDVEFTSPKPPRLIRRMLQIAAGEERDIVMDFFAGSGTTGHAVNEQNALDGKNRRYVLVQLPEITGNRNFPTIFDITKERLRRAGKKIHKETPLFKGDVGFRVFKLASSNIKAWEPDRDDLPKTLAESVEHLKTDRTESDILFELLLKLGLDLTVPIEEKKIAKKSVHSIGAGTLLVCLAPKIAAAEVEPLALGMVDWHKELAPAGETTVVFRDSAFADDVAKTNLTAILQQHGLETVRSL